MACDKATLDKYVSKINNEIAAYNRKVLFSFREQTIKSSNRVNAIYEDAIAHGCTRTALKKEQEKLPSWKKALPVIKAILHMKSAL